MKKAHVSTGFDAEAVDTANFVDAADVAVVSFARLVM